MDRSRKLKAFAGESKVKHITKWNSLIVVLSLAVAAQGAFALESPLDWLRSLSHGFFVHSSQGYLGVDLKDLTPDRVSALKLKDERGVEIITVDHDAPAAKAGLRVHDVVLQMNGQPVESCEQLRRLLRKEAPGQDVNLVVSRDGSTLNINVQLADRALLEQQAWSQHFIVPDPDAAPEGGEGKGFVATRSGGGSSFMGSLIPNPLYVGVDLNPVHTQLAEYFGVASGTGLLVENVDSESPASRAGLQAGDVILKVNANPMITRDDWLKAIRANRGKAVQLTIVRNKQQQTLTMVAGSPKRHG